MTCARKLRYLTPEAANIIMARQRETEEAAGQARRARRLCVYRCACGFYHVGHRGRRS